MSAARRHVELPGPFSMYAGGSLPAVTIACETWGELSGRGDNAVLLFTGLSPSAHAASSSDDPSPGWWEFMIGPGKPIDTERFFVICINSLGSCFGSTGPASIDPRTGDPYRLEFPALAVEDIASAAREAGQPITAGAARAEARDPQLGAVVLPRYERARSEVEAGVPEGPFRGVPFLLKDLHCLVAGERTERDRLGDVDEVPGLDGVDEVRVVRS